MIGLDAFRSSFPIDVVTNALGDDMAITELYASETPEIMTFPKDKLFSMCAHLWHRMVTTGIWKKDPSAMAEFFNSNDERMLLEIAKSMKTKRPIREIYYLSGSIEIEKGPETTIEYCVARSFLDELMLVDIYSQDLRHPLKNRDRRSGMQKCKGFGILGSVIENLYVIAAENQLKYIVLSAATRDEVPLFEKHGFEVEDGVGKLIAMKIGRGIPMIRNL